MQSVSLSFYGMRNELELPLSRYIGEMVKNITLNAKGIALHTRAKGGWIHNNSGLRHVLRNSYPQCVGGVSYDFA